MSNIVNSLVVINGTSVTSDHIGKKLKVVSTKDSKEMPIGAIVTVENVRRGYITIEAEGNYFSIAGADVTKKTGWKFEWVDLFPVQPVSLSRRRHLAKTVKDAKKLFDAAVKQAQNAGMVVTDSENGLKITYQPKLEVY